jgi:uncharacterized protein YjdB
MRRRFAVKKGFLKKIMLILLTIALVISSVPTMSVSAKTKVKKATSVTLNKSVYTLKKGGSVTLKATISPKNATTKIIQWSSSKPAVATVSNKGKVTAKKNGTAKIMAKVKGTTKKATCKIVVGTPVTSVKVASKSVKIAVDGSSQIEASVLPKKATTKKLSYISSDEKVATVSSSGKITGKKVGTAKITVIATDGSTKKAIVKVTVAPKVSSVSLNETSKTMTVRDKITLKATVKPNNAITKTIIWTTSNKNVATVNNGKVTAVKVGRATITAKVKGTTKTAKCAITVEKKATEPTKATEPSETTEATKTTETTETKEIFGVTEPIEPTEIVEDLEVNKY